MLKAYKNLNSKTRLGVGAGIIAWGVAGLYISDAAEEKLGFTPTEQDRKEVDKWTPRLTVVDAETNGKQ